MRVISIMRVARIIRNTRTIRVTRMVRVVRIIRVVRMLRVVGLLRYSEVGRRCKLSVDRVLPGTGVQRGPACTHIPCPLLLSLE